MTAIEDDDNGYEINHFEVELTYERLKSPINSLLLADLVLLKMLSSGRSNS